MRIMTPIYMMVPNPGYTLDGSGLFEEIVGGQGEAPNRD